MTATVETVTALANLLVAVQGAILALYFATRRHTPAIASVNVVLLVCSLSIFPLNAFTLLSGIATGDTILQNLSNGTLAAIGPSLFLHASHRARRIARPGDLIHYLPTAVVLTIAQWPLGPTAVALLLTVVFGGLAAYLVATVLVLIRHAGAATAWLGTAVVSSGLVVGLNTVIKIGVPVSEVVELNTPLLFAVPIFALLFDELGAGRTSKALRVRPWNSAASPQEARAVVAAITRYLDNGAYRRPNLTVREIAADIGVPIKWVSSVVNAEMGKSVPELITTYRIEDIKRRLADPDNQQYTILALAAMSGFGSGPRFNTVFRDRVGMTPSEYKRRFGNSTS